MLENGRKRIRCWTCIATPATLARDIALLNLFPRCAHVKMVVLMSKIKLYFTMFWNIIRSVHLTSIVVLNISVLLMYYEIEFI